MRAEEANWQAEQFLGLYAKNGGDMAETFARWADSKDFGPLARFRIREAIGLLLTAPRKPFVVPDTGAA